MPSFHRLQVSLTEHRAALDAFVESAAGIPEEAWSRPVGEGKWSPGQIAEHLALALELVRQDLDQRSRMRFVLPAWKRLLARRLYLPRLLKTGRFPAGARAPREIRPSPSPARREETLERLRRAANEIEMACASNPRASSRKLAHPYFGALAAPAFLRLLAWHTHHHRAQLPGSTP
jgi:DinB family protein